MPKQQSSYICQQCGFKTSQFYGKCPECGTWNSLVETVTSVPKAGSKKTRRPIGEVVDLSSVEKADYQRLSTKISEFDRVLGGGIVAGSIVLIAGDPGIGKSTLLTQLALHIEKTLYVAGEESPRQIKLRADRILPDANVAILPETDVD